MKIFLTTEISNDVQSIAKLFNQELFQKLSPPMIDLNVKRFDGCKKGDEVHLQMGLFGIIKNSWVSKITADEISNDEFYFIDEGTLIPPPLIYWKHVHRVKKINDSTSLVIDDIEFTSGNKILDFAIYPALFAMFSLRKPIYIRELNKK